MKRRELIICWLLTTVCFILVAAGLAAAFSIDMASAELSIKPGGSYSGSFTVNNDSKEPASLKVYLGDWRDNEKGTIYFDPGKMPRGLSQWMHVTPAQMTVPAGGSEKVYYEVTLPHDPNLAGSYWGMIFVEGMPQQSKTAAGNGATASVGIITRYAQKVYVTIPGTEIRHASFTDAKVSPTNGVFDMTAILENQGNIFLRPHVWLELRDQAGKTVYSKEDQTRAAVLPEGKYNYTFELRGLQLPLGKYTALVIADFGAPSMIAAQASLEITTK